VHWAKRLATILRPSLALRHPCCPIHPRRPYLPKGAKGPGNDAQPVCWSTDDPMARRERVRHRVCVGAKRLATILGTAGGQGPLEAAIGAANETLSR
jgi:hypothetical protein